MAESDKSNNDHYKYKPLIYGMGGGVLLGILMGFLLDDPALGIAFGITVGSGAWYALYVRKKNQQ